MGRSIARIRVRSTVGGATGEGYDNEYVLIVRGQRRQDRRMVNEYLDTLKVMHYEGLRKVPADDSGGGRLMKA